MVVCTVHLNQILLHVGPFQHVIHAATTTQDTQEKPITTGVLIFFLLGREHFPVTQLEEEALYLYFVFLCLPDKASAVLESKDRCILDIDMESTLILS